MNLRSFPSHDPGSAPLETRHDHHPNLKAFLAAGGIDSLLKESGLAIKRKVQGEEDPNTLLAGAMSYRSMFILSAIIGAVSWVLLRFAVGEPRKMKSST